MGKLEGRVALITGGARGMGKSHVRHLVAEGARVVFGDVRDEQGQYVADKLGAEHGQYVHLDVTSSADWAAAVALTEETFGRLDVLVNNAGILTFAPIAEMTEEAFRRVLGGEAVGPWLGKEGVIGAKKGAGRGAIGDISPVEGFTGAAGLSA